MLTKYQIAHAREVKAKAEALAEFMDEYISDKPYVFDDYGNRMTREQVLQKTREGWKDNLFSLGYSPRQVKKLESIL